MVYKHAVVAAFCIYAQCGEDAAERGGWRTCIKSHGNYIVDHGKSWKNYGIVVLNFCGNPDIWARPRDNGTFQAWGIISFHLSSMHYHTCASGV